ncbi:hypothetical protein BpHYR1_020362 [Brachionus plicatilis]|uniref:Uncharacterized protein n=1 Tax=Brachionus plicatilis TaxID=10195 RepID=A0A3M7RCG6_BRAPC|nr:hypothetical protein BpHYR1_020362 [Brachionus plicatilis]
MKNYLKDLFKNNECYVVHCEFWNKCKIVRQNVSADTNLVPAKLSLCKSSANCRVIQRLDLVGTKFVLADKFCRTIFTLINFVRQIEK